MSSLNTNTNGNFLDHFYTTTWEKQGINENYLYSEEFRVLSGVIVKNFSGFAQQIKMDDTGKRNKWMRKNRNHPLHKDWSTWKSTVRAYFSDANQEMAAVFMAFIDSGGLIKQHFKNPCQEEFFRIFESKINSPNPETAPSTCRWCVDGNEDTCVYSFFHLRMDAMVRVARYLMVNKRFVFRASMLNPYRKYYIRLIKSILSVYWTKDFRLTDDLIEAKDHVLYLSNNLLGEIYDRALLENPRTDDIAHMISCLSGVAQEQGGSLRHDLMGSTLFPPSFWKEFMTTLAKEQGFMNGEHSVRVSDETWERLTAVIDTQRIEFMHSFSETIGKVAVKVSALFLSASLIAALVSFGTTLAYHSLAKILNLLYALITKRDPSKDGLAREQAGGITIPFLPAFFIQNIINPSKEILSKVWNDSTFDRTMRRIGFLGDIKVEKGIEKILTWLKTSIHSVYAWYMARFHGISVPEWISGDAHAIRLWNDEVDKIVRDYYDNSLFWNETTWSHVYSLYAQGLRLAKAPAFAKWKNDVWKVVQQLSNVLEKFKQHNKDGNSIRNPPVTIYLAGGTGVGKSTLSYPLAAAVLKEIFKEEPCDIDLKKQWKSMVYQRSSEQEFWDAFENQLITIFDDFSQRADSSANPNLELFEIIRTSNCFPYPLHMAELSQKAVTQFTSKIIIVSSNQEKPITASLNYPEALYRRFDICVRVSRRSSAGPIHKESFDPEHYTFDLYDMCSGASLSTLSYKDLVDMSVRKYRERKNFVRSIEDYIDSTFDDEPSCSAAAEQGGWTDWFNRSSYSKYVPTFEKLESVPTYLLTAMNDLEVAEDPGWAHVLASAVGALRMKYHELDSWWGSFHKRFPFLETAITTMGILTMLFGFLSMFMWTWKAIKGTDFAPHVAIKKGVLREEIEATGSYPTKFFGRPFSHYEFKVTPDYMSDDSQEEYRATQPLVVRPEASAPVEEYSHGTPCVATPEYRAQAAPVAKPESYIPLQQGVKDLNASEVIHSGIRSNLYKIYDAHTESAIGHVLFVRGRIAVFPKHFMRAFLRSSEQGEDAEIYFRSVYLQRAFCIRTRDLLDRLIPYQSPDESQGPVHSRDLMACDVVSAMMHTDIVNQFCPFKALTLVGQTEVAMPVILQATKKESHHMMVRYRRATGSMTRMEVLPVAGPDDRIVRFVRDAWRYEADTEVTECGAPLIVRNRLIQPGKICGIHIAGIEGTGEGFSTPVYREDIEAILSMFPKTSQLNQKRELDLRPIGHEQGKVPSDGVFIRLGKVPKGVSQPVRTKIRPSLVHRVIRNPRTKPCLLRPMLIDGEQFSPREYRLRRLGCVPSAIRRDALINSRTAFIDELCETIKARPYAIDENLKSVYTFQEAVKGIDGDEFVNSIKRTTSPGFPFVVMSGYTDRHKFFGTDDVYNLDTPQAIELKRRVDRIIDEAKQGNILEHVFIDTLKDERKPIHKAHKTRLFSAGPLDYLVACKMYFNGVVALLQRTRNASHISVGTNPYSRDWHELAKVLLRKSPHMVAGDFEGFDASEHLMMLEEAIEVLVALSRRFLGASDEDCLVMRVLGRSLLNSIHLVDDEVVQWTHSLPSGHYLTAIINSVLVNIAFCCCWQISQQKVNLIFARSFWRECGIVAYGDDHIVSIPESRLGVFNQLTMPGLMKVIGLSYTMEDKDQLATQRSRPLQEVSYLKRKFTFDMDRNKWIAPLSLDTILETPMWIHQTPDERLQTAENLTWALKELSLHDAVTWQKWHVILQENLEKLGVYKSYYNQQEVRDIVFDEN